uniref:Uncharacterized protein n=1 Tax=uncultured bacterium CSLF43 TaxID=1091575 RepID=G4WW26_9BACT|nr:hypothetical protein [uncultured bacterium CSLF43]
MCKYIGSNNNRFWIGLEAAYGNVAASEQLTRIPAVSLKTKHQRERLQRKDKTGTRTFLGLPAASRYQTSFELNTYMSGWTDTTQPPAHDALFTAAFGPSGLQFAGGVVASASGTQITFATAHGLALGQAISCAGEIRFVTGIVNTTAVQINASFTSGPAALEELESDSVWGVYLGSFDSVWVLWGLVIDNLGGKWSTPPVHS